MYKEGDRVRYIRVDNEEYKRTGYFPPVGTLGTVIKDSGVTYRDDDVFVHWDKGTSDDNRWYCSRNAIEPAGFDNYNLQ